ncbi:thioredoxin family protein [Ottowia sp.]|uniref:thioredoxin family protein n=1 Tax=Ottowia sp. TaxID=1898956 RepID=UPI0025D2ADD8|nr:thioredoxin family protein [Ottowia sp.]MBK6616190.1 thioredoxin family protein [Ottowia sp.]
MLVTCLCATWCLTCEAYRATFAEIAERFPDMTFRWVDIEDESDVVGELDIQNFPTLLIQSGTQVRFFGTVTPQPRVLEAIVAACVRESMAQRDLDRDVEDLADRFCELFPQACGHALQAASAAR